MAWRDQDLVPSLDVLDNLFIMVGILQVFQVLATSPLLLDRINGFNREAHGGKANALQLVAGIGKCQVYPCMDRINHGILGIGSVLPGLMEVHGADIGTGEWNQQVAIDQPHGFLE